MRTLYFWFMCWHKLTSMSQSHVHTCLTTTFQIRLALTLEIRGSNVPSMRSPVMDAERMRSGHWLGFVLCVSFSALTLLVGWQEGHLAHKKPVSPLVVAVWHCGSALVLINEVNLRRARLALGWVTCVRFDSWGNQPARLTQPSTVCGMVKWVPAKGQWCSVAGE